VSDYGLDDRAIGVRSPAGEKDFFSNLSVQTGSGAHPASSTMGTGGPFPGGKARPGRDADHSPHLVPRSWMSMSYISSPPKRLHGVLRDCCTCTFTLALCPHRLWGPPTGTGRPFPRGKERPERDHSTPLVSRSIMSRSYTPYPLCRLAYMAVAGHVCYRLSWSLGSPGFPQTLQVNSVQCVEILSDCLFHSSTLFTSAFET
jgi:hypothetical protein